MATITNIYRIDPTNVGDYLSSPALYFNLGGLRVRDLGDPAIYNDHLILGGGGLLYSSRLPGCLGSTTGKMIAWGIGLNGPEWSKFPAWLDQFDLVGVRDTGSKYKWCPCVSCMHGAFDESYNVEYEYIVYEHKDKPLVLPDYKGPCFTNRTLHAPVILGRARTIITNSYHGAYWGYLLGRRVLIVSDGNTKFNNFPWFSHAVKPEEWGSSIGMDCTEALRWSRAANVEFHKEVTRLIGMPQRSSN